MGLLGAHVAPLLHLTAPSSPPPPPPPPIVATQGALGRLVVGEDSLAARLKRAPDADGAVALTSTSAAARDATALLMGLPRDPSLRGLPVRPSGP